MKKAFALIAALGMVASVTFNNSILAGTTLVRDNIKSENYTAGSAGWKISRNGDAEFNNLIARGSFISGDGTGKRIEIDGTTGSVDFYTADPEEAAPGSIQAQVNSPDPMAVLGLLLTSPESSAPTQVAQIQLSSQGGNANGSSISLLAESVGMSDAIEITTNETWHNITLLNSWATLNSLTPQYRKDIGGVVSVIGRMSGGTSGIIGALPSGYRPKQVIDIPLKCNNDAGTMCWLQVNTVGTMTVVGNVAAAQTWLGFVFNFSAKA